LPEGHTLHRLAAAYRERFAGRPVRVTSPQGGFAAAAALLDGTVLRDSEAHGKHLFLGFGGAPESGAPESGAPEGSGGPEHYVHVHLGLFGKVAFEERGDPGTVRLRIATGGPDSPDGGPHQSPAVLADLRGPAACELLTPAEADAVHDRLGPDPLRPADTGDAAWQRISRSRSGLAVLLMDQKVVSGVGNIYRAEVLFRHGIDPHRPGRDLTRPEWDAVWADLRDLMREGVRTGRIDTVRPEHTPEAMGRPPRVDGHGGEVYVYRRAGQPCLVCGTEVRTADLAARNLFWCPGCQAPSSGPAAAGRLPAQKPKGSQGATSQPNAAEAAASAPARRSRTRPARASAPSETQPR
jgi:endonuclease-8